MESCRKQALVFPACFCFQATRDRAVGEDAGRGLLGSIAPPTPRSFHLRLGFSEAATQDPLRGGEGALVAPNPSPAALTAAAASLPSWGCSGRRTGPSWRFFKWRLTTE